MDPLFSYLADHHGVLDRHQAERLGVPPGQIRHHLRMGRWVRAGSGVYRVASAPDTWEAGSRARALSCQAGGAIIHRSNCLDLAGTTVHRGLPLTGIERAVVDTARVADDTELHSIVDAVVRQRLTTVADLLADVDRHGTRGRAGLGRLRRLLTDRLGEHRPPDSRFNRLVGQLLIEAGLPAPAYEYEIHVGDRLVGRLGRLRPAAQRPGHRRHRRPGRLSRPPISPRFGSFWAVFAR